MSEKSTFFSRFRNKTHTTESPPKSDPQPTIPRSTSGTLKREQQIDQLLKDPIIELDKIRNMAWAGIPSQHRARIWRLFLDYEPVNTALTEQTLKHKRNDYFDCMNRVYGESQRGYWTNAQKTTITQIQKDLPRTSVPILRNERVKILFERVLFVYSVRHPASGYVQGMNDVLQPFFFAFLLPHTKCENAMQLSKKDNVSDIDESILQEIEADCFWCFSKLLDGLQDLYTKDQPGLYKMLESLQNVVDRVAPKLSQHIIQEEIQYQEFAFRWVNCLLVREFSMEITFRIWDSYLAKHNHVATTHIYVCAAILDYLQDQLIPLNHSDFVMHLQSIEPNSWSKDTIEEIFAQAYVYEGMFSRSPSHLKSASMPSLLK